MKSVTFVDAYTGIPHSQWIGPDHAVEANTPPGCKAVEGHFDMKSKKLDVVSEELVDHTPPQIPAEVLAHNAALMAIMESESKSIRAIRELLLNPSDSKARRILLDSDTEIAIARTELTTKR